MCFCFYLGFLSRTFTNHRSAGEGGGHFFNSSLPLPPTPQALRHQPANYCRQLTSAPLMGVFVFTFLYGNISFLHGIVSIFQDFYFAIMEFVLSVYIVASVVVSILSLLPLILLSLSLLFALVILLLLSLYSHYFFCFNLISVLSLLLVYYQSLLQKLNLVRFVP